jgi:hypothetical protein
MIVFMVIGCGKKDPLEPTVPENNIMPLGVGITWTYDFEVYQPGDPNPFDVLTYYIEILGQTTIDNESWYYTRHLFTDGVNSDSTFYYYTLRDSGLYVREGQANPAILKVVYPTTQGTLFNGYSEFIDFLFGFNIVPAEVISTSESATVPQGTYACHHYSFDLDGAYQHEFYAPNMGLVRSDLLIDNGMGGFDPYISLKLTNIQF